MTEWKVRCPRCGVEFFVKELPARCEACGYLVSEEELRPRETKTERGEIRAEARFPILARILGRWRRR